MSWPCPSLVCAFFSRRLRPCPSLGCLYLSLGFLFLFCFARWLFLLSGVVLPCLVLLFAPSPRCALGGRRSVLGVGGGLALVVGSGWLVFCGLLVVFVVASRFFGLGLVAWGRRWPLRRGGWAGGLLWWVGGFVVGWSVDLLK